MALTNISSFTMDMDYGATTFSIMAFSITTLSPM